MFKKLSIIGNLAVCLEPALALALLEWFGKGQTQSHEVGKFQLCGLVSTFC